MVRFIIPKLYQIIRFVLCGASGVCRVSLCRTIYYRCSLPMLLYTFRSPPHRLRFFVWKQPFRSGPYCGDTCCPPLLGGEGGPGFLLRVRGFVLPNRRSPDGGCAARHLVRMLLCIPIPTMFRGGGSMRCAMPAGKPHSAAECRSPKFVQFRRRWTLSSSERPLKYIKGYLG